MHICKLSRGQHGIQWRGAFGPQVIVCQPLKYEKARACVCVQEKEGREKESVTA